MKLIAARMDHVDTITLEDMGIVIGVLYYSAVPINDDGKFARDEFREWFEKAQALMKKEKKLADLRQYYSGEKP